MKNRYLSSRSESLQHTDLIKIGRELGYDMDLKGSCFGIANMAMQAVLIGDIESYNQRINRLNHLTREFVLTLKNKLSGKDSRKFTSDELDIRAFYEGVVLYQDPDSYKEIYGKQKIKQDVLQTANLTASDILKQQYFNWLQNNPVEITGSDSNPVSKVLDYSCASNQNDLTHSLQQLADTLNHDSACACPFSMIISGTIHTINVSYLPPSSNSAAKWLLIDANQLPPKEIPLNNIKQLAEMLTSALNLGDSKNTNAIFKNEIIVAAPNRDALQIYMNKWKKDIENTYAITPENALLRDGNNHSLFYMAVIDGNDKLISKLIQAGIDVNKKADDDFFALSKAAVQGDLDVVTTLIKAGAKFYQDDDRLISPLHAAILGGHLDIINTLIRARMPVEYNSTADISPLNFAISYGHLNIVSTLYDHLQERGIAIDLAHAAYFAIVTNQHEVLDFFTKKGIHGNTVYNQETGKTLLMAAIENNQINMVEHLLTTEINLDVTDNNELTPIMQAAQAGHLDIVKVIFKHSQSQNNITNLSMAAYHALVNNHYEIANYLIDNGVHPDSVIDNRTNKTLLIAAVEQQNEKMIGFLLEHGANPFIKDKNGETATIVAKNLDSYEILKMLFEAKKNSQMNAPITNPKDEKPILQSFVAPIDEHEQTQVLPKEINEEDEWQAILKKIEKSMNAENNLSYRYAASIFFVPQKSASEKPDISIQAGNIQPTSHMISSWHNSTDPHKRLNRLSQLLELHIKQYQSLAVAKNNRNNVYNRAVIALQESLKVIETIKNNPQFPSEHHKMPNELKNQLSQIQKQIDDILQKVNAYQSQKINKQQEQNEQRKDSNTFRKK